jgi:hypothetical protein
LASFFDSILSVFNFLNYISIFISFLALIISLFVCFIDRKFLTIKGIFTVLTVFLSFLLLNLLFKFNGFIFNGRIEEFSIKLPVSS